VLRNVVRARQKQFFLAGRKLAQSGAGSNRVRNNRFELCKHVLRLVQVFEANALTYFAVPATHRLPHPEVENVEQDSTAHGAGVFSEMRDSWNYPFKELGSEVFFGDFRLRKATSF